MPTVATHQGRNVALQRCSQCLGSVDHLLLLPLISRHGAKKKAKHDIVMKSEIEKGVKIKVPKSRQQQTAKISSGLVLVLAALRALVDSVVPGTKS